MNPRDRRRLESLKRLAARTTFKGERDAALAKIAELEAKQQDEPILSGTNNWDVPYRPVGFGDLEEMLRSMYYGRRASEPVDVSAPVRNGEVPEVDVEPGETYTDPWGDFGNGVTWTVRNNGNGVFVTFRTRSGAR